MPNKFKPAIKTLVIIHTAMLVGMLLFGTVIYFITAHINNAKPSNDVFKILQIIAVAAAIGLPYIGFNFFKKRLNQIIQDNTSVSNKLEKYKVACIVKYALIEAPVILNFVAYFITQNTSFIILGLLLIVFFGMQRPNAFLITNHLQLSNNDLME